MEFALNEQATSDGKVAKINAMNKIYKMMSELLTLPK